MRSGAHHILDRAATMHGLRNSLRFPEFKGAGPLSLRGLIGDSLNAP